MTTDISAPTLSVDAQSLARAAFDGALRNNEASMDRCLDQLSSEDLDEVWMVLQRLESAIQCAHLRRPMQPSRRLW